MFYAKRLFDVPYHQVKNYPNATMFATKIAGDWIGTSTQQFLDEVMLVSRGLIALNIQKGDRVSVSANNRPYCKSIVSCGRRRKSKSHYAQLTFPLPAVTVVTLLVPTVEVEPLKPAPKVIVKLDG